MSRYDGLIIPRSYSEYINKTDAATLQQALQLSGVLSGAVAAGDNKAVKSSAVNDALVDRSYNTKYKASLLSGDYSTYLTIPISASVDGYQHFIVTVRIRNSIREIHFFTNDGFLFAKGITIDEHGFIPEVKWSSSTKTLYIKTYRYAGQPTFYLERCSDDSIAIGHITHSTTPYTLPSDAVDV